MQSVLHALVLTIFGAAFATPEQQSLRTISRSVDELHDLIEAAGGCNVIVCCALDSSGSVSENQFITQKNFVFDIISTIAGNPLEAAAVQYGLRNRVISFLTPDIDSFILDLDAAEFAGDIRTSIGGGIVWCHRQLGKRRGEANKMVVMGDGRNNLGGSPVQRANLFTDRTGGKVCAVGIGFGRNRRVLMRIAGGDRSLVLTVDGYIVLADILEELVSQICGVTLN